jgi:hypothetical protein
VQSEPNKEKVHYLRKVFLTIGSLSIGICVAELKLMTQTIVELSNITFELREQIPILLNNIRENRAELMKLKAELSK